MPRLRSLPPVILSSPVAVESDVTDAVVSSGARHPRQSMALGMALGAPQGHPALD